MSWLSKLLNYVPANERDGISLKPEDVMWEASPTRDLPAFLRGLMDIMPAQSILYLEGGYPNEELVRFLEKYQATHATKVAVGTIWPRPGWDHLPITPETIEQLAQFAEKAAAEAEIANHLHVYKNQDVLLEWHDAFDLPFFISKQISEEKVKNFCAKLGIQYKRH